MPGMAWSGSSLATFLALGLGATLAASASARQASPVPTAVPKPPAEGVTATVIEGKSRTTTAPADGATVTVRRCTDGKGRVAAVEIMVCNSGIRAMIRDDKLQQIQGSLQAGAKDGMQTLNAHLAALVKTGKVSYEVGVENCSNRADFDTLVGASAPSTPGQVW